MIIPLQGLVTTLPLDAIPNQELTVTLDDNTYDIVLKEANEAMAISVSINNKLIVSNILISANTALLPANRKANGNFYLYSLTDDYPYYTNFGITEFLIYLSDFTASLING